MLIVCYGIPLFRPLPARGSPVKGGKQNLGHVRAAWGKTTNLMPRGNLYLYSFSSNLRVSFARMLSRTWITPK